MKKKIQGFFTKCFKSDQRGRHLLHSDNWSHHGNDGGNVRAHVQG
jgi:hypothetical protein